MAIVKITFGADTEELEALVGVEFSTAVTAARQVLDVPADVSARLNGSVPGDLSIILRDGDEISFYKASGSKGF